MSSILKSITFSPFEPICVHGLVGSSCFRLFQKTIFVSSKGHFVGDMAHQRSTLLGPHQSSPFAKLYVLRIDGSTVAEKESNGDYPI
jgi:hypothetical protein